MWKKFGSKIQYKIILPFVLINLITALTAGPIARSWVADQIEKGANELLRRDLTRINEEIAEEGDHLKISARNLAELSFIEKGVLEKDLGLLRKVIIPQRGIWHLNFVEVIGKDSRVFLNIGGPYQKGEDLSSLDFVNYGWLEMTNATLINIPSPYLVAASPVHYPQGGISGLILVGIKIDTNFLKKFTKKQSIVTIYQGVTPIASNFSKVSPLPRKISLKVYKERKELVEEKDIAGERYRFIYVPLFIDNRLVGVVSLGHSLTLVSIAKGVVTRNVILLNFLLLISLAFIGYIISLTITKPLKSFVETARKVASGELSFKVRVKAEDEIGELANSFNLMIESLREHSEALNKRVLELTTLYDVSKVISSTLDFNHLLHVISESAMKAFHADESCVLLFDPKKKRLVTGVCQKSHRYTAGLKESLEKKLAQMVKKKEEPLLISNDEEFLSLGVKSAIGAPISVEDKFEGVIVVGNLTEEYTQEDLRLLSTLAHQGAIALQNARLFQSLQETYMGIVKALAFAVDAKDPYTRGHSEQVAKYALMIADELKFSDSEKKALEMAAYLHDIGKIGVSDQILSKETSLTKEEIEIMKGHPSIGAEILTPIVFPWEIVPTVRHHHEHYGGGGYPQGLSKEKIPLGARILALADSFDAMTSDRPYRSRKTVEEAVKELKRCSGTQFDPELVKVFLHALKKILSKRKS